MILKDNVKTVFDDCMSNEMMRCHFIGISVGSEETNSAEDQIVVRVLFPSQETLNLMGVPESLEGIMSTCLLSRLIYLTVMVSIGRL